MRKILKVMPPEKGCQLVYHLFYYEQRPIKRKGEYLYNAVIVCHAHKALRHGSHSFT